VNGSAFPSWQIGEVTVTKIVELVNLVQVEGFFPGASTAEILEIDWLRPEFVNEDGDLILSIHALVVDTPGKRIMVDTCIGNDKARVWPDMDRLQTAFLDDLQQAGFPRESFDLVLCTHLHVDHIGWNTMLKDGVWVPTFPNARYLISRTEHDFWKCGAGIQSDNGWSEVQRQAFADSVQPVRDAGLIDLVDGSHEVCDEVSLVPTPGHSPGHVSIAIRSKGHRALITGDFTHHPAQLARPEWGLPVDYDSEQAIRTRQKQFADLAGQPVLVIGTHWAGVTAGRVSRDGVTYRLDYD